MPRKCYKPKNFQAASKIKINQANEIIEEYLEQGYTLTLRQLYYQYVARDLIPNSQQEYKKLGDIIKDARIAGLIDWHAIVDRTRNVRSLAHWDSPEEIIAEDAEQYRRNKWENQKYYVECWIEKDALIGVIERPCEENDISYFACRGYVSVSEIWSASQRLLRALNNDLTPIILHLGDHDPSGIDCTRDIIDRLDLFTGMAVSLEEIEVRRLALNIDQVRKYNPPPNPTKLTDSRAENYLAEFGSSSWELDALEPSVISALVTDELEKIIDEDAWQEVVEREDEEKGQLQKISDSYDRVVEYLDEEK